MKIEIFGNIDKKEKDHLKLSGFTISKAKPELIFIFGGDGSLMFSEQKYPRIPKVMVKKSKICKKCSPLSFEEIVSRVKGGQFKIDKLIKLEAKNKNKTIVGINDIVVHNANPRHAIRYSVKIAGIDFYQEVIGDGIVASTPFGSLGYFRSITDSVFYVGMGLAFNNSTESTDHMVISDDSAVEIKVIRGPAECYADNNPKNIPLEEGESVTVKKSMEVFNLVHFKH